jgi:hypothetical protein
VSVHGRTLAERPAAYRSSRAVPVAQPEEVEPQLLRHHRLGGGTAAVAAVLGLMCLMWAVVEATQARITMSSDGTQGQYPCGSVLRHRPACDASVYSSGTTTTIVASVLTLVLLTFAASSAAQVVRRRHAPVGVER